MNTGEKNVLGRTIYRGPRGGLYVLSAAGSRISKFKKAPAPAPPAGPPKNVLGRTIYKGPKGGLYVLEGTRKIRTFKATNAEKARARASTGPTSSPRPAAVSTVEKLPTPSPRPAAISTVEKNKRLAAIRARLKALEVKRLADLPKSRKNIEAKLRLALRRTRARMNVRYDPFAHVPSKHISITFCHTKTAVPRVACKDHTDTTTRVFTGPNPLIESGAVVAMHENDFDLDWYKRQSKYISKLSDYDFWTVQAHTHRSHSWIGPYTYEKKILPLTFLKPYYGGSTHILPLWPQIRKMILNGTYTTHVTSSWVTEFKNAKSEKRRYQLYVQNIGKIPEPMQKIALDMYIKDLKRIIAGAPRSRKKMILYRGSNVDIFRGSQGHWHTLASFCSSSYAIDRAFRYGTTGFTRVTVLPNTPVLLVAGVNNWDPNGEQEIMVNIGTRYLIRGRGVKRHVYRSVGGSTHVRVTDVTIAK